MKSGKIKILHIITNLPVGGAQDNTLITVDELDKERYEVTLMSAEEGDWLDRALKMKNVKLIFVNELVRPIHLIYDIIALLRIYRIIRKGRYDIVHTHSSKPGFSGRIAAKLAGVPIIVHTVHGFPFNDFMNPLLRSFFITLEEALAKISNVLVTVSKLNFQKIVDLKIADPARLVNIYSGIYFDKFDKKTDVVSKKKELGIDPKMKVIGMVGRLSNQKSPQYFLDAIPAIAEAHPDTRFLLIGDGELRDALEKRIKKLGIHDRTQILGFRDDVPDLLQVMDIYVLSSCWEGLGRSLTEAMYLKKPVVATAVEGVPEIVETGKTGVLVPPRDPESISRAVISLLGDPAQTKELGENAHRKVAKKFSAHKMVEQIDQLYQELHAEDA
ncbi:MAG: glycosyltransferase family 4 protein [candidate division KSB1 bacterium]|jgi:glycosyltransferase involved in cell wall biosynthesis|nr:glycosyltransferase family 4 protein [candidate division KSB1 bacterium]